MPSHWFRFATKCCANSTATDEREDNTNTELQSSLKEGDRITSIHLPVPVSSPSSSIGNFTLLSYPKTPSTSSTAAAAVAVSHQSPKLICVASESDIVIYSVPDVSRVLGFPAAGTSSGAVKSVVFSSDDSRIFTAHQDCRIRVWSASVYKSDEKNRYVRRLIATLPTTSDCLRRFALPSNYVVVRRHKRALWVKHVDVVSSLAVTDNLLYSVSWDKTIKIWNPNANYQCLHTLTAHDDAINIIAVSPDGIIYTASSDKTIKVWKIPPSKPKPQRTWIRLKTTAKESNDNQGNNKIALLATLEKHSSTVNALALSSDGSVLYSGGNDRSIVVWERGKSTNQSDPHMVASTTLVGHEKAVMCLTTVDGLVISGSSDLTVRIWRRSEEEYQCVASLNGHRKVIRSLTACCFTGGSGTTDYCVCSGSVDGEVRVWKVMAFP